MMDFKEQIKLIGDRFEKMKNNLTTEEATKTALVLPFLQALGYDIFNPTEIIPEFVADIGSKKGEKVDYAVFKDNEPIIIIECKHWQEELLNHNEQIFRYFAVVKAKFGILTNGFKYMIFTDLEKPNVMDEKPFFEFDLTKMRDVEIEELKKFQKSKFDINVISSTANELKYSNAVKTLFNSEIKEPSEMFVRHFAKQIYDGQLNARALEQFTGIVKRSIAQIISDTITDRLNTVISVEGAKTNNPTTTETELLPNLITTTQEELEGFYIVRSILRKKIAVERVVHRDRETYFGIILDDNNRKPICRLHLDSKKKYITLFDEKRKEVKHQIITIDDIYQHSTMLETIIDYYLSLENTPKTSM